MSRTPTATCDTAWMLMARTLLRQRRSTSARYPSSRSANSCGRRERREVPAVHLVGLDAEALAHDPALEVGREEAVVATQQEPGRHVGPRGERPRLLERRPRLRRARGAADSRRDVGGHVVQERSRPDRRTRRVRAPSACPVFVHQSPPDSPGRGTIAATRTISSTGTRSHTSGATNPPATARRARRRAGRRWRRRRRRRTRRSRRCRRDGKVDRDDVVTCRLEDRHHEVPVPRVGTRAGQEHERRHGRDRRQPAGGWWRRNTAPVGSAAVARRPYGVSSASITHLTTERHDLRQRCGRRRRRRSTPSIPRARPQGGSRARPSRPRTAPRPRRRSCSGTPASRPRVRVVHPKTAR